MRSTDRILLVFTGGTIVHRGDDNRIQNAIPTDDLVETIRDLAQAAVVEIGPFHGADLTLEVLFRIRDEIRSAPEMLGCIVVSGTDGIEELSYGLDLALDASVPVVVTGAMRPPGFDRSDGRVNLRNAVKAIMALRSYPDLGVVVVMNDAIYPARYVRKSDATRVDGFASTAGALAEIRSGRVWMQYTALPSMERFSQVNEARATALDVLIWTASLGGDLPSELEKFDGLVISGMGTGSIPELVFKKLTPNRTSRIPTVLVSRCDTGFSYDEVIYRDSLVRFERAGFLLRGFEGLSAPKARLKLIMRLAAMSDPARR